MIVQTRPAFSLALFCGMILVMRVENLDKQVELLSIIVDDCKRYPAYTAIRPATGHCKPVLGCGGQDRRWKTWANDPCTNHGNIP